RKLLMRIRRFFIFASFSIYLMYILICYQHDGMTLLYQSKWLRTQKTPHPIRRRLWRRPFHITLLLRASPSSLIRSGASIHPTVAAVPLACFRIRGRRGAESVLCGRQGEPNKAPQFCPLRATGKRSGIFCSRLFKREPSLFTRGKCREAPNYLT